MGRVPEREPNAEPSVDPTEDAAGAAPDATSLVEANAASNATSNLEPTATSSLEPAATSNLDADAASHPALSSDADAAPRRGRIPWWAVVVLFAVLVGSAVYGLAYLRAQRAKSARPAPAMRSVPSRTPATAPADNSTR